MRCSKANRAGETLSTKRATFLLAGARERKPQASGSPRRLLQPVLRLRHLGNYNATIPTGKGSGALRAVSPIKFSNELDTD